MPESLPDGPEPASQAEASEHRTTGEEREWRRASFLLTGAVMTGAGLWVALLVGRAARSARGPGHAQAGRPGHTDLQAAG